MSLSSALLHRCVSDSSTAGRRVSIDAGTADVASAQRAKHARVSTLPAPLCAQYGRDIRVPIVKLSRAHACVIIEADYAEGSHNGSAAVLKTAVRKDMQVRVLSPPPFLFLNQHGCIQIYISALGSPDWRKHACWSMPKPIVT